MIRTRLNKAVEGGRARGRSLILPLAFVAIGCANTMAPPETTESGMPTLPAGSAPKTTPPPSTPEPSPSGGTVAPIFQAFDGFTFVPVESQVADDFKSAVTATLGEAGSVGEIDVADAIRGAEPAVTAIAFSLTPTGEETEQTLFGLVLEAIAGGLQAQWERALDGQAFSLETADQSLIVLPWATREDGTVVFLLVTGPPDAPVEEVARGMAG